MPVDDAGHGFGGAHRYILHRRDFEAWVARGYDQVPLVRRLDLGGLRPTDLLRCLDGPFRFLLESTRVSREGRYSFVGSKPHGTFFAKGRMCWRDGERVREEPVQALRLWLGRRRGVRLPGMPLFCGGAVGYFAYEASRYFEDLPRPPIDDVPVPDIAFLLVRDFMVVDHLESALLLVATGDDFEDCSERLDALNARVRSADATPPPAAEASADDTALPACSSSFGVDGYLRAVGRIQDYIRAGDTYQVNLSQRLMSRWPESALALYERLSALNPVHFASYFEMDGFDVVSASPERLVRVENRRVWTRPIAGTRRKGTSEENARFIEELRTNEKELAEHSMLVDLERNDLGRVCEYGSVEVKGLMEITEYAHVIHIESEVAGELRADVEPLDVVGAMFPGGTITGVPKLRTMEIIAELEPTARGLYTGSIGYLSFAGEMDLNIVIRSILLRGNQAYVHVGGGVVYDSEPRREHQETLNKARSQLLALGVPGDAR